MALVGKLAGAPALLGERRAAPVSGDLDGCRANPPRLRPGSSRSSSRRRAASLTTCVPCVCLWLALALSRSVLPSRAAGWPPVLLQWPGTAGVWPPWCAKVGQARAG